MKKHKNKKPTVRKLTDDIRKMTKKHDEVCAQFLDSQGDLTDARRDAKRYEKAYRDLKNNLAEYLAMFAAGTPYTSSARVIELQRAMFREPKTADAEDSFSTVYTLPGAFGSFALPK